MLIMDNDPFFEGLAPSMSIWSQNCTFLWNYCKWFMRDHHYL